MRDGSRLRCWLDDAASSVKRTAAVGLERFSSFGSPRRASRAKTRAPAWEADARARLARSPSEKSAEERLDEDFAKSDEIGDAFGASARGESGDFFEDEDAASDVTMRDVWEALRGAPNPKIPPDEGFDARRRSTAAASGSGNRRGARARAPRNPRSSPLCACATGANSALRCFPESDRYGARLRSAPPPPPGAPQAVENATKSTKFGARSFFLHIFLHLFFMSLLRGSPGGSRGQVRAHAHRRAARKTQHARPSRRQRPVSPP